MHRRVSVSAIRFQIQSYIRIHIHLSTKTGVSRLIRWHQSYSVKMARTRFTRNRLNVTDITKSNNKYFIVSRRETRATSLLTS